MTWFGAKNTLRGGSKRNLAAQSEGANKYLIATGAIVLTEYAASAKEALCKLKERLHLAYDSQPNPYDPNRLSWALIESFADGKLDFIVMDGERTRLICGEYGGVFEEPVTRRLADKLGHLIPDWLEMKRRAACLYEFEFEVYTNAGAEDRGLCA